MPDAQKLSNPPKFGTQGTPSPSPQTIGDWVSFWRWLTSLWAVARESINFPEARAIIPPGPRGASLDEAIGASKAFQQQSYGVPEASDAATIQALSAPRATPLREFVPVLPQVQPKAQNDNALTFSALSQSAYGARQIIFPPPPRPPTTLTLEERIVLTGTTIALTDFAVIGINFTGSSVNFALPTAVAAGKQIFLLKSHRQSTDPIVIVPSGADTINGQASYTLSANEAVFIQSDTGSDWNIELAIFTTLTLQERIELAGTAVTLADFTVVGINFTGGSVNFTLPSAVSAGKQLFLIKSHRLSTNPIVIVPNGADTITGAASLTLSPNDSVLIQSDTGTDWNLLLQNKATVTSLNTLTGAITLAAGTNISLTPVGNTVTIAATGGSTPGVWSAYTPVSSNLSTVSGASGESLSYGTVCFFWLTITGTPTNTLIPVAITLPVTPATNAQTFPVSMVLFTQGVGGVAILSGGSISVSYANPGAWSPNPHVFTVSGSYKI